MSKSHSPFMMNQMLERFLISKVMFIRKISQDNKPTMTYIINVTGYLFLISDIPGFSSVAANNVPETPMINGVAENKIFQLKNSFAPLARFAGNENALMPQKRVKLHIVRESLKKPSLLFILKVKIILIFNLLLNRCISNKLIEIN